MSKLFILLCALNISIIKVNAARILGVIPTPSYSHQVVFQPLWKELSLRNHEVTVLTTDPIKDPKLKNLMEIDLSSSYAVVNENLQTMIDKGNESVGHVFRNVDIGNKILEQQLQQPKVRELIKDDSEHFDLVLLECTYLPMLAFTERFKCPGICVLSTDAFGYVLRKFGNPFHPVLYPYISLQSEGTSNFLERLMNVLFGVAAQLYIEPSLTPALNEIVTKYFGPEYPPISDLFNNVHLLFVNSDLAFHPIKPLLPSIISIGGGIHIKPPKPLPKDLQKLLDESKGGFIYFSLGGNVKSKDLSEAKRKTLMDAFSDLPYRVLWKFELGNLTGKPDNVIISKWFPQQDILRHPNLKLFITHGGLQSIDETIYAHVPIVGIPFFVDQPLNVRRMVTRGCGLGVDHERMDKETLKKTILEVINNPSYRNRIKELAAIAVDQPMTGLERAVWWTEYAIRHKGAKHLHSPYLDIPTYQYYFLDVIAFCLAIIAVTTYLLVIMCRFLIKLITRLRNWRSPKVKVQ